MRIELRLFRVYTITNQLVDYIELDLCDEFENRIGQVITTSNTVVSDEIIKSFETFDFDHSVDVNNDKDVKLAAAEEKIAMLQFDIKKKDDELSVLVIKSEQMEDRIKTLTKEKDESEAKVENLSYNLPCEIWSL